jgi:hypothetical protein
LNEADLELIQRLVDRLERLSADSTYAHQASGLRGSLYRLLDRMEAGVEIDQEDLHQLLEQGFMILQNAAKEVGVSR